MIVQVTIVETTRCSWYSFVTHTRHSLCSAFLRDLNLLKCVPCFNIFQFSRLWYQTQILRIVNEELRHINSATAWFIYSGSVFRMPLSIVYLEPREEGLGLIDVKAKSITFFLNQCIWLLQGGATLTGEWIELWNRTIAKVNLLICFQYQMVSSTYVFFRGDLPQSFRYLFTAEGPGALIPSVTTGHDKPLIRILIKYACAEWTTIWENIPSTPLCDETRSTWYRVVTWLHNIKTQNTRAYVQFTSIETLLHRLAPLPQLCQWTRHRIVAVLRTDHRYVMSRHSG